MRYENGKAVDVKISYIGGGSRGWAWTFMSDLSQNKDMSGTVYLYDIDYTASQDNEKIGNAIPFSNEGADSFRYKAVRTYREALEGADFVIISILPGTFDEMESDVHTPEKYGIYQSVGDTAGVGGVIRSLRTLPMFFEFAEQIKKHCPDAFVINYTNPMALCVAALYRAFPEIKCYGCCHEVFGTQTFLSSILKKNTGIDAPRQDIKVNVVGVNHFTWLTEAHYRNIDLFPMYRDYCEKYVKTGTLDGKDDNWMNNVFECLNKVKMDLFLKFGYIAAAGDRHLAEFCPPHWYLKDPETAKSYGFTLTPVSWRKDDLVERLARRDRLLSGTESFEVKNTGEEGVIQMCSLLGFRDFVTNVNIPNRGQISNLPLGAVVETNARFCSGSVTPVLAGPIPDEILPLIARSAENQKLILDAAWERSLDKAFVAFLNEPMNNLDLEESRALFDEMCRNTAAYLKDYH